MNAAEPKAAQVGNRGRKQHQNAGLRLLIYDRTCRGKLEWAGLSSVWWAGAHLYQSLGRLDACRGVASWSEALAFLLTASLERPISEVQFWGHGKWGEARIGSERLDARALLRGHPLEQSLAATRRRLESGALWWFRTCETFGAEPGQHFARLWADFLGARVAGHTHIIGFWQSGLHLLAPGEKPTWPVEEGVLEGSPREPLRARWSGPHAPNTITCLEGRIPENWG